MRIFKSSTWYIAIVVIVVVVAAFFIYKTLNPTTPDWVTATVERGTVQEVVSVSGVVEAKQAADLSFPTTGTVTDIFVIEGDEVEAGELLATLAATELVAERAEAVSALAANQARYEKTVAGPRGEAITVANTTLENARENLRRVTAEENQKVKNAEIALRSTDLSAKAVDPEETSTPPTVSGSYTCETEGSYLLTIYSSGSQSGYSYTYTGPEEGSGTVTFEQPSLLGTCGLYLRFTAGDIYSRSEWQIEVPNTRSSSYAALTNALSLANTLARNAIANAKDLLTLAQGEAGLSTAPARPQEIAEGSAAVSQAGARIAAIDARIADRSIVAPFTGIITDIAITKGESAPSGAVLSLLADKVFYIKARIPEIDITKITLGQNVTAVFDARSSETLTGKVTFVSPIATQIDGVAYFETTIELAAIPDWMRAGLNADIDIITKKKDDVLRLPKRFVFSESDSTRSVLTLNGTAAATTSVEVLFTGNDSFVEIGGLPEGTTVVAP